MKLYVWRWTDCTNSVHLWLLHSILITTTTLLAISANLISHEHNAFNTEDYPSEFSPARRGPQGFDSLLPESSASYRNVLQFPIRNFTKVATIRYTNNENNKDDNTTNKSKNTYSSIINARPINMKKPALVLTLSLKPPYSLHNSTEEPHPLELIEQATTALITHTINQTLLSKSTEKPYNILDRLRNLSNQRSVASGPSGPGLRFGIKSFGNPRENRTHTSQIKYSAGPVVRTTKFLPTTGNPNDDISSETQSISPTATPSPIPTSTVSHKVMPSSSTSSYQMPRLPPPSPLLPANRNSSTSPIVLKVGKLSQLKSVSTPKSTGVEGINTGETRVAITADQLSGNRPTSMPFHFTTGAPTPPPPSTTARRETPRINRYQQHHSPHNHAFAPTRDPVSDVNDDEDLSVEDFRDIRVANLVFGSKVGTDVSTPGPSPNQVQATPNVKSWNQKSFGKPTHSTPAITGTTPSPPAAATSPPRLIPLPQTPKPIAIRNRHHQFEEDVDNEIDDEEEDEDEYLNPLQKNFKNRPSVKIVTQPPTTTSTTKKPQQISPEPKFTRQNFFGRSKPSNAAVPPTLAPLPAVAPPDSASASGDNTHAALNDNLPFYKEPGGIFKEHNSNKYGHDTSLDDDDDLDQDLENDASPNLNLNQIAHNSNKSPKVKYAPNRAQHTLHNIQHPQPAAVYPTNNPNQFQYVQQQPVFVQQHHPPQNIYFQPVPPTPFYPQGQIYPTHAPAFVPIQQLQGYQHHQAPLPSPPVYQHQHQPQPQQQPRRQQERAQNYQNNYAATPPPIAPRPINRDNFPSPDDPDSDSFYGDPRPDTSKPASPSSNGKKNSRPPPLPPREKIQQGKNSKQNNRKQQPSPPATGRRGPDDSSTYDEEEDEEEPEEDRRQRPANNGNNNRQQHRPQQRPNNNPERPLPHQQQYPSVHLNSNPKPNRNDRSDDYDTDFVEDEDNGNRGGNRGRGNSDYDGDFNNPHPSYDNGRDRDNSQGFRPSQVDRGPIRPSSQDFNPNSPNFDHPNIQYPNRGRGGGGVAQNSFNNQPLFNRGPEFDPRGFGVGFGPAPRTNLDPIYTRTIKQYDQDLKKAPQPERPRPQAQPRPRQQPPRNNGNRNRDDHDDDHSPDDDRGHNRDDDHHEEDNRRHRDDSRAKEQSRRRPPSREEEEEPEERPQKEEPEEEEEEEEKPVRPRRPPPPPEKDEEEEEEAPPPKKEAVEEEEEEEEEEAEEEDKDKKKPAKEEEEEEPEAEEEEEEEEEPVKRVPLGNRQRKGGDGQQGKKQAAAKKPPNEKSGDLEDDIRGIEQEFGMLG